MGIFYAERTGDVKFFYRPDLEFIYLLPLVRFFVRRGHPVNIVVKYTPLRWKETNSSIWKVLELKEML